MTAKKQHGSKANWSSTELKQIRKCLEHAFGSGPRAQQALRDHMSKITNADATGRKEAREKYLLA